MTVLGQRIRLDPNNVQASWLERCAGASRFIYNLGLERWKDVYKAGGSPSWQSINAEVNARKKADLAWLCELPWAVSNKALADLGVAFTNFFRRVKAGQKPGYPRFKSRKRSTPAFAIEGRALQFDGRKVKLPKLGWLRVRQPLRFPGKVLSARFTKHADHWYLSVQVEVDESKWSYPNRCETQAVVGVDLGVVDLAVLSDGTRVAAPRVLRRLEHRLRMFNKQLGRRAKGGKNRLKTRAQLAQLHERIANVRKDVTHRLTADVVRRFRWIGVEDLNIAGMTANHCLAKSVADAGMGEVLRQLKYKVALAGSTVVVADRWYASSKTCSECGVIRPDLTLGERRWTCPDCGTVHDRDINAAINLKQMALAQRVTACCQGSAGRPMPSVELPRGQESSSYANQ